MAVCECVLQQGWQRVTVNKLANRVDENEGGISEFDRRTGCFVGFIYPCFIDGSTCWAAKCAGWVGLWFASGATKSRQWMGPLEHGSSRRWQRCTRGTDGRWQGLCGMVIGAYLGLLRRSLGAASGRTSLGTKRQAWPWYLSSNGAAGLSRVATPCDSTTSTFFFSSFYKFQNKTRQTAPKARPDPRGLML